MITQERLKELLHYDPDTGVFTANIDSKKPSKNMPTRWKAGRVVGSSSGAGKKTQVDGKEYALHNLAWLYVNGEYKKGLIKHKNSDQKDNRIENLFVSKTLRDVSLTQDALKKIMHYNKHTGEMIRLSRTTGKKSNNQGFIDKNGYIEFVINRKRYSAHRLTFLYVENIHIKPNKEVDHIDGNPSNNAYKNLRIVSHKENLKNTKLQKNNKSGVTGVSRAGNKWYAQIMVDGKALGLGRHKNKETAITIRKAAEFWFGFHKNHGQKR